jgi:hypothetical protein
MTTEKDNLKDDLRALIERKCNKGDTFDDYWDLYQHLDYDGSVYELVDGYIDIDHHALREWAVDNYHYVVQAMDEGLCEGVTDFHKLIQCGQYVYYNELSYECIEELFTEYNEDDE